MIRIPNNNQWQQNNRSDLFGNIWSSFNLDLTSKMGVLKNTRMLNVVSQEGTNETDIGLAVAFRYWNSQYWAATHGTPSLAGTERTSFAIAALGSDPTTVSSLYSDMEVFNEKLYISLSGTNLAKNTAGTWGTVTITGAGANVPKPICVYGEKLYVGATAGGINSMTTGEAFGATIGTTAGTLQLSNPTSNTITFMRATSSRIWIGTVNQLGGKGHIYAWDGTQTSVNETYRLESSGALAAVVKDDVLYVMDANGKLLAFNGGTFVEIDRLPIKQGDFLFYALGSGNARWIHPNGMTVQDGKILILINNEYRGATATTEENVPSGIWEWSKETGLYHKYSPSYHLATSGSVTDYGHNNIDVAGAVAYLKSTSTAATDNGSILAGMATFTGSGATAQNLILIDDLNDTIQKYGYFVTPKIFSENITETWQKIYLRFKKFLSATDKIVVKYRTADALPLAEASITWYNDTLTFKTSSTVTTWAVGNEVEILQGAGSGKCAHITAINDLGGGETEVVLDETFTGVTNTATAKARAQKWIKLGSYSALTEENYSIPIDVGNSSWIQFKVCLQHTGASEFYDLTLINAPNQKAV